MELHPARDVYKRQDLWMDEKITGRTLDALRRQGVRFPENANPRKTAEDVYKRQNQHRVKGLGYSQQTKISGMYGHRMCLLFSKKLNHLRYHALSIFKPRVLFIFKITHIGGIE